MKKLIQSVPINWCNDDIVLSSLMEAVSLVTPVLEHFFIRTVNAAQSLPQAAGLNESCLRFMREEANHAQAHQKLNAHLLLQLGKRPLGLAMVEHLLDAAQRHLNLQKRLAVAAALEHFAAVLSKLYIDCADDLRFSHAEAQQLFAMHAQEELGHRSVVFDLWLATSPNGRFKRGVTLSLVLMLGSLYVAMAVPWVLYRKTQCNFFKTAQALLNFAGRNAREMFTRLPLAEMLSFASRDYHPEHLLD